MCPLPQVAVQPGALSEDGSGAAASVAVSGGNRVRLTDGVAVLKDVRLTADAPGTFCVVVASASRRVRRAQQAQCGRIGCANIPPCTLCCRSFHLASARSAQHDDSQTGTTFRSSVCIEMAGRCDALDHCSLNRDLSASAA